MIARVVPLLRLPRSIGVFDYLVDPPLPNPGMVVTVPFRKRRVPALVLATAASSSIPSSRLRRVIRVLAREPLVDEGRMRLVMTIARETFNSPATVARSFVPDFPVTKPLALPKLPGPAAQPTALRAALERLIGSPDAASIVTYRRNESKAAFIRDAARAVQTRGFSTLIVSPTIAHVRHLIPRLEDAIPFLHDVPAVARRNAFLTIRALESATVIGTRSALMAPLARLGLIIIDDEDHDGHVQTAPNPRFDTRRIALILARETGSRVVFMSRMPSLVTGAHFPITATLDKEWRVTGRFIDLGAAWETRDYRIVAEAARQLIEATMKGKGRVLVVHARRSDYGSIECRECGFTVLCPTCNVPMPQEGLQLVCRHCARTSRIPARCPRCGSVRLKGSGRGIASVRDELARAGQRVTLVDASNEPKALPGTIDLMTFAHAESYPVEALYNAVIVTRFDSALSVPRVDAEERARRLLVTLGSFLAQHGTLAVQASPSFRNIVEDPLDDAWRIRARNDTERFGYPPAWKLIMLRIRSGAAAKTTPAALYRSLIPILPPDAVTAPQPSKGTSRRDRGGTLLLIRVKKHIPRALTDILTGLDEHWTITINPTEIK